MNRIRRIHLFAFTILASLNMLWPSAAFAQSTDSRSTKVRAVTRVDEIEDATEADAEAAEGSKLLAAGAEGSRTMKDRAWLGVSVEEATEALSAQLGLEPGVGLVVRQVSEDGPGAKAGLKKHDVLVALAGQSLVHPAQLRKLVQSRKPGEQMDVVYYRSGKKENAAVTLDKTPARLGLLDENFGDGGFRELHRKLLELRHDGDLQMPLLRRGLETEVKRGMEQAHKAIAEAAREVDRNKDSMRQQRTQLKELLKSGISVDDNATVVLRNNSKSTRSTVKTDNWGTILLVGPPNLHLTARDKSGQTLFEGEIETPEQRAKVPAEVWKRVEPLLDEK